MKEEKNNHNNKMKGIIMVLAPLVAIYLGVSVYFMNRFYFGTTINSISVMGKTVEEANSEIENDIAKYSLEIKGRNDSNDTIKGLDINLKYNPQGKIEELKKNQKPFIWITSLFNKDENELNDIVTFDEELLKSKVKQLSFVNNSEVIEPKNPQIQYGENGYEVIDEVKGNKIDEGLLYKNIYEAIKDGKTSLDIDEENSYYNPKYTKDSQEVADAKSLLEKYSSNKITYNFGDRSETVDGEQISKWLFTDEDMNVEFDKDKVRLYVDSLARKYNTCGDGRKFKTSSGNTITTSGGTYGWIINKPKETEELINTIKEGKESTREPIYEQKAISRNTDDIGDTYVEVDLTKQHLWFYKNGSLVVDANFVSGDKSKNWLTRAGVYGVTFKSRDYTLKGENYATKVSYWMPFDGNIGLHDATWRGPEQFVPTTYLTNGSHGCVNLQLDVAQKIFEGIEQGDPVICYY